MCGRASEIQVLILFVTIMRAEIADLPEVVAQSKRCAFRQVVDVQPLARRVSHLVFQVLFEMVDANKDGKVTESEALTSALARFDRADTNKDGKITPDERRERRVEIRKVMKDRRAN